MAKESNSYTKHHYVPETYLKNFSGKFKGNSGVYAFPRALITNPVPTRLQFYTPAQICRQDYLYRISNETILNQFEISDANVVEKQAFKRFENNFNRILAQLPGEYISYEDAELLIRSLLNLKIRNPYYMFGQDKLISIRKVNEEIKAELYKNYVNASTELSKINKTVEEYVDELDRLAVDPQYPSDIIKASMFLDAQTMSNDTQSEIVGKLLSKKWVIRQIHEGTPFITSDNPGFTLMEKERTPMNLYFLGNFEFTFPLTSTLTLVINSYFDDKPAPTKFLGIEPTNEGYLKATNYTTILNAYQYLYSGSQETLLNTLKDFKRVYPWFRHQ